MQTTARPDNGLRRARRQGPRGRRTALGTGHTIDLAHLFENDLFEPLDAAQAGLSDTVTSLLESVRRHGTDERT
ncbi:hypothetical protein [Streptomyces sp. AC154]|uniref:hypothetical protein n=1 Tax=Streptomyces sp. AC154 TaxID=3143184 RepID=UPI003F805E86